MKKWFITSSLAVFLFLLFLIWTFPFDRLAPRIAKQAESALSQVFQSNVTCESDAFGMGFPLKLVLEEFRCSQGRDLIFDFDELFISLGLFSQALGVTADGGQMEIRGAFFPGGNPSSLEAQFSSFPLQRVTPLVFELLKQQVRNLIQPEIVGRVQGSFQLPLQEFWKKSGRMDLEFQNLSLPSQSILELIGLSELKFKTAVLKFDILEGKLVIERAEFLADELGGKALGSLDLQENLMDSTGDLNLKWKVSESTALRNSIMGPQLLQSPCPNRDPEGFCTQKVGRLSEISRMFMGGSF